MIKSLRQFNVSLMRSIGVRQFLFSRRAYGKSAQTPLVESLRRRILTTGPLTVADYMRECLTNPHHVRAFSLVQYYWLLSNDLIINTLQ